MKRLFLLLAFISLALSSSYAQEVKVGADQIDRIVLVTKGKRVGIVGNQTSILSNSQHTHLLDTLLSRGVKVTTLYSPEHGFRGDADAGASVNSAKDNKSGLPIISLYGKNKKPSLTQLAKVDVMLFDLQDVGVRFYTYISTLKYVMEACADAGIPVVVLDRPNPHDTVDGPVLKDSKYKSFVSILPIPAVHGMTIGEIALMIKGEKWLESKKQPDLSVIEVKGWKHGDFYHLVVSPSPNLRSDASIRMYPTLCYFEATTWSVARGTSAPFEQIGYPDSRFGKKSFTPRGQTGATSPKYEGRKCYGPELIPCHFEPGINIEVILDAARMCRKYGVKFIDRPGYFNLLAGNSEFMKQIERGWSAERIRKSWQNDLADFHILRKKYLLYKDDRTF